MQITRILLGMVYAKSQTNVTSSKKTHWIRGVHDSLDVHFK